jgi:hypothetical protein
MPSQITEIKIFLASPGDVKPERDIVEKVVTELNRTTAHPQNATIRLLRWETDTHPYFHVEGPQEAIYEQLEITDCDIFLCILWKRLGTPTKHAGSGTEDEFWKGYEAWKKNGQPKVMLYHCQAPYNLPSKEDRDQLNRLMDFLENDKFKSESWITPYKDANSFEDTIRPHLTQAVQKILKTLEEAKQPATVLAPPPVVKESTEPDINDRWNFPFSSEDWKIHTYDTLDKYYVELPEREAIAYFDGREPIWKESISPSISRREIVQDIKKKLIKTDATPPHIVLLQGLGGEGKSTALQQAVYEAVKEKRDLHILWHQDANSPLDTYIIEELADTEEEWIIASDDADIIMEYLQKAVIYIRMHSISNIRFLLATREVDWKLAGGKEFGWALYADLDPVFINKFTKAEARDIVEKWSAYGKAGLGNLTGEDFDTAAQNLLNKARTEMQEPGNSLLGAMLQTRKGVSLQAHLEQILARLEKTKTLKNLSLKRALAYICALHAYNVKILTPQILAHTLQCSEQDLYEKIILPLGNEVVAGTYILIRHTSIAETIKNILKDSYDFNQITRALLKSAHMLFQEKRLKEDNINDWHKLPKTVYFEKGDISMGVELATEAVETLLIHGKYYDPVAVTDLADMHEKSDHSDKAVKVFREYYSRTKVDRAYYYKWGVAEGKSKHRFLGIWLEGISLADGIYEQRGEDPQRVFISLSGLSTSLKFAHETTSNPKFLQACYASAKFGLRCNPDERASNHLRENLAYAISCGTASDTEPRLSTILDSISEAWSLRKKDLEQVEKFGRFPENLSLPLSLRFNWLAGKLRP